MTSSISPTENVIEQRWMGGIKAAGGSGQGRHHLNELLSEMMSL